MYSKIIKDIKNKYGAKLAILGHHYQSDEIIQHTDLKGDSLELARQIGNLDAEYIVFCGVHFMAESAAILRKENQKIFIPDKSAGCVMANMAPADLVEKIIEKISKQTEKKVIPLAYVNTPAAVKAVCGKYDGSVCTSANAVTMMKWALEKGDSVLFLPDKNLAMNTADKLGLDETERYEMDIRNCGDKIDMNSASKARLIMWPGLCPIHQRFKIKDIDHFRTKFPEAKIAVHPECPPELVKESDADGSTSFLIKYVEQAPDGATIVIGTETNLVDRLAAKYKNKTILPLGQSFCSNMAKITEKNLAELLQNIENFNEEDVDDNIRIPARKALERMLEACS
jgi:quinolinate synthase